MSDRVTYPLKHPVDETIVVDGVEKRIAITDVRLRRLKGKDHRFAAENSAKPDLGLLLLARLTGLTQTEIDELDGEDLDALEEIVEGFSGPGRQTGTTS